MPEAAEVAGGAEDETNGIVVKLEQIELPEDDSDNEGERKE
jgi:hypothetical protein